MRNFEYILGAIIVIGCLCSCATTKPHVAITAPVRTNIERAQEASQRSSVHIKAFKNDAERIDYKSARALKFFP